MKKYRITYALSREDENIYSTIMEAHDLDHIFNLFKCYINEQHGFLSYNTIAGLSILELKD